MRIIEGFKLRKVAGQAVVAGEGIGQIDFNRLVSLNPTAAWLWEQVAGREFTEHTLARLIVAHYGIDEATALGDASDLAALWRKAGLVED